MQVYHRASDIEVSHLFFDLDDVSLHFQKVGDIAIAKSVRNHSFNDSRLGKGYPEKKVKFRSGEGILETGTVKEKTNWTVF